MKNLERISSSSEALNDFLHNEFPRVAGVMKYIDFDAWCDSEDKKFPFKGEKCTVEGYQDAMLLVDTMTTVYGAPYCIVVNPETLDYYKVPKETVYILEDSSKKN